MRRLIEDSHTLHSEDAILKGKDHIDRMLTFYKESCKMLLGEKSNSNFSVKWDGAPAILMFTKTNKFGGPGVSTKSLFNTNPKYYTTEEEILSDNRPEELKNKLLVALKLAQENIIPDGEIWQGDMLFTKGDIRSRIENDIQYNSFQPNTIIYMAPADSDLGRQFSNADIGIVWHTRYDENGQNQSNDATIDKLNNIPNWAFMLDAKIPNISKDTFSKQEFDALIDALIELRQCCDIIIEDKQYDDLINNKDFIDFYVMTLQNHKYDIEEDLDPNKFIEDLHLWINKKMHKQFSNLDKLKTKKGRDNKRNMIQSTSNELHHIVKSNNELINNIANGLQIATEIKNAILEKMNNIDNWITKYENDSGLHDTGHEGFVVSDVSGNFVKFVDRSTFSHLNRDASVIKGWEGDTRTQITESEEKIEGKDYIILEFGSQKEIDEFIEQAKEKAEFKGLLQEAETATAKIAKYRLGDKKFDAKYKAEEFIKELKSMYYSNSYVATLSKDGRNYHVKVEKVEKPNEEIEIDATIDTIESTKKSKYKQTQEILDDNYDSFNISGIDDKDEKTIAVMKNIIYPILKNKSINIGYQPKEFTTKSITLNIWGPTDPLSKEEIINFVETNFNRDFYELKDDSEKVAVLVYRQFKVYFRNTHGGKSNVHYFNKDGDIDTVFKESFKYSDKLTTNLQEALTGLFLVLTLNNKPDKYEELKKLVFGDLSIDLLPNFPFLNRLLMKGSSLNESGYRNFINSWKDSIINCSSPDVAKKIKDSYKKLPDGEDGDWRIFHSQFSGVGSAYVFSDPILERHLFSNFNYKKIMSRDTANPADIFLINMGIFNESFSLTTLKESLNNIRGDISITKNLNSVQPSTLENRDDFVKILNNYFDMGILVGISLKKSTNNTSVIKAVTHNSLGNNMKSGENISCFYLNKKNKENNTISDYSYVVPPFLNKTGDGKSAYLKVQVIKKHLHLENNNDDKTATLKMDIRIPSSGKLSAPPVSEILMDQAQARFGKSTEAVQLILPNFMSQYRSEMPDFVNNYINNKELPLPKMMESLNISNFEKIYNLCNFRLFESEDEDDSDQPEDSFNPEWAKNIERLKALKAFLYLKILIEQVNKSIPILTKIFARGMKYKINSDNFDKDIIEFNNGVVNYFKIF